jgi:DNA-binding response OmpR family regulator
MASILIVQSERRVADTLGDHLRRQGYATTVCASLTEAERFLTRGIPDLMILENCWPENERHELLHQSKRVRHIPTIVIGSPNDACGSVEALDGGADDYMRKPFSLAEATARVRALFRRSL